EQIRQCEARGMRAGQGMEVTPAQNAAGLFLAKADYVGDCDHVQGIVRGKMSAAVPSVSGWLEHQGENEIILQQQTYAVADLGVINSFGERRDDSGAHPRRTE